MTTNNYILCRWRDAISDPPPFLWQGLARYEDGATRFAMHRTSDYINYVGEVGPVVQWLDITDRPGVAREAVQAAVDEVYRLREPRDNIVYTYTDQVLDGVLAAIRNHTGVTPSEVQ